ncbi:MAG TPA: energy transducer TonB [Terriglobales bacterium]|nr:energy transducer TonB [Terriglobales bacterium]
MTGRLRILRACTLTATLLCCYSALAKDNPEEKARPLLKAAAERSLFHADKSAPFGMLFKFELRTFGSKPAWGAYSWMVTPDGDWRQETKFLDYSDLEISRGTTLWIKRSVDYRPLQAVWVEAAFSNFLYLNRTEDEITRYSTTSEHHVELRCVDLLRDKTARTLCFDAEDNLRKVNLTDSYTTYEFSDFRPIGKKFAPYKIVATREGRVVVDGAIEVLTRDTKFDPALFDPPAGAIKRDGCLNPTLPSLKKKVDPEYPSTFRSAQRQGTVSAYVLITSDGGIQNPRIVQTGGQYLDASVLKAVPKWQFEPAKCGDVPIDYEAEITINFALRMTY